MNEIAIRLQNKGVRLLPDSDRYKMRFDVKSSSSNRLYRVSFDTAPGSIHWVCSCPGFLSHGHCKHLTAMGLKGRGNKDFNTLKYLTGGK